MSSERLCLFCGQKLPEDARQDARYCAARCRVRACRQRKDQAAASTEGKPSASNMTQGIPGAAPTSPQQIPRPKPTLEKFQELVRTADERIAQLQQAGFVPESFLRNFEQKSAEILAQSQAKLAAILAEAQKALPPKQPPISIPPILRKPEPRLVYNEPEKTEKQPETMETVRSRQLQQAIQAGYNPAEDILAFAKLEELEAFDRLARWQTKHNEPLTIESIPAEADREHLAAVGAIQERLRYHANRPTAKWKTIRWIHEGWELDPDSEADLLRQVYDRIKGKLRIPSRKAG